MKYREKKVRNVYSNCKYDYHIYIHTEHNNIYHVIDKFWHGHYWEHDLSSFVYIISGLPKKIYNNKKYDYLTPQIKSVGGNFKIGDKVKQKNSYGEVIATVPVVKWSHNWISQESNVKKVSEKIYTKNIEKQLLENL